MAVTVSDALAECLTEEQITALTCGALSSEERELAVAHSVDCPLCLALVGELLVHNAPMPATVGRYQVRELLGAGGMGVVVRAFDPTLQRDVAIKMLHANSTSAAHRARMLQEARALAKLSQGNIVSVFDCGEMEGEVWLAMELIDGEPLHMWLLRTRPSRDARMAVALGVADGLVATHAAGLLHRDVKPSNVLVRRNGQAVVIDFGLVSQVVEERDGKEVAGTPSWMAPETLAGQAASAASDQYQWWGLVEVLFADDAAVLAVAARGRARSPSDRFSDMKAAAEALQELTYAGVNDDVAGAGGAAGTSAPPSAGTVVETVVSASADSVQGTASAVSAGAPRDATRARAATNRVRSTLRRRWALVAGLIAAAAVGVVWWQRAAPRATTEVAALTPLTLNGADHVLGPAGLPCADHPHLALTPQAAVQMAAALVQAGQPPQPVLAMVSAHVVAFSPAFVHACTAYRQGSPDAQAHALRTYLCLRDQAADTAMILDALQRDRGERLRSWVDDFVELPAPAHCEGAASSRPPPPPPAQAQRVRELKEALSNVMAREQALRDKRAAVKALAADILATDYQRLIADYWNAESTLANAMGDLEATKHALSEGLQAAQLAGDDAGAVTMLSNRLGLATATGEPDTVDLERLAEAMAARTKAPALQAKLLMKRALLTSVRGDNALALAQLQQAATLYDAIAAVPTPAQVAITHNLAAMTQMVASPNAAVPLFERAYAQAVARHGVDSEHVWQVRGARATNTLALGERRAALVELQAVRAWLLRTAPDNLPMLSQTESYLCEAAVAVPLFDAAIASRACPAALTLSEQAYGSDGAGVVYALLLNTRFRIQENAALAVALARRAVHIVEVAAVSPAERAEAHALLMDSLRANQQLAAAMLAARVLARLTTRSPALCATLATHSPVSAPLEVARATCAKMNASTAAPAPANASPADAAAGSGAGAAPPGSPALPARSVR